MNGTIQAGPRLERAVRHYVRAYASLHGRRKAAEHLGVSRHTLWRFLERGHVGRSVPSTLYNVDEQELMRRAGRMGQPDPYGDEAMEVERCSASTTFAGVLPH